MTPKGNHVTSLTVDQSIPSAATQTLQQILLLWTFKDNKSLAGLHLLDGIVVCMDSLMFFFKSQSIIDALIHCRSLGVQDFFVYVVMETHTAIP